LVIIQLTPEKIFSSSVAGVAGGGDDFGEFKARRVKNGLFPLFWYFLC
jgi:hypothetical protein